MSVGTIVAVVVNILFVLLIIAGFFIGFWRGLKKSALNAGIAVVGALIAFFITIPITKLLLGIRVNGTTIDQLLVDLILTGDVKNMVAGVPSIETLIRGLPLALASSIVFIVVTMLLELLLYFVYLTFWLIFLRDKKYDLEEIKPNKHRVWGGVIGGIKTLALAIFALMPLTSLFGLAGEITSPSENYLISYPATEIVGASAEDGNIVTSNIPPEIIDGIKAYNSSAFAFTGGLFKLDDAMFDYLAKVKVDGKNVKVRAEISQYWKVFDIAMQIKDLKADGHQFKDINFDKVEPVLNDITKSNLYKTVVVDFATYVVKNYQDIDWIKNKLGNFETILENIKNSLGQDGTMADILDHDLNKLIAFFKDICTSGAVDEISSLDDKSVKNILDVLIDKDQLTSIIDQAFDLKIVRLSAKTIADLAMKAIIKDAEESNVDTGLWNEEKWTEVTQSLKTIVENATSLLKMEGFDFNNLDSDFLSNLMSKDSNLDIEQLFTHLGTIIDELRANPLFVNSEDKPIIDAFLKNENLKLLLPADDAIEENDDGVWLKNEQGIEEKVKIVDYKTYLSRVLMPSMIKLRDSGMFDLIDSANASDMFKLIVNQIIGKKEGDGEAKPDPTFLSDVILPLYQVEPTKSLIIDNLFNGISGTINFGELKTYEDWKNDLGEISNLLVALNEITNESKDKTGIDLILGGGEIDFKGFMLNIDDAQLNAEKTYLTGGQFTKVIKPLLKAKSTSSLASQIFTMLGESLTTLLDDGESISVTYTNDNIDQLQEICDISENFLPLLKYTNSNSGSKISDIISTDDGIEIIGHMLNSMEVNAYRSADDGIFKAAFLTIADYIEETFQLAQKTLKNEEGNYKDVNFADKLKEFKESLPMAA